MRLLEKVLSNNYYFLIFLAIIYGGLLFLIHDIRSFDEREHNLQIELREDVNKLKIEVNKLKKSNE